MKKLVVALGMLLLPYPAMSETSGVCGETAEACSYVLDDNGKLTITGNGEMSGHNGYTPPWGTNIKEVSISGITSIASHAFVQSKIKSIEIPDTVTSIGAYIFEASKITSVALPSSLNSLDAGAFSSTNIDTLIIPDSLLTTGAYFSKLALTGSKITNLICPAEKQKACEKYLANAQEYYWPDEIPESERTWPPMTRSLSGKDNIKIDTYTKDENGNIIFKNKKYASFSDMTNGHYIPKRIYTIEEANAVTGKKNKVMIKYR